MSVTAAFDVVIPDQNLNIALHTTLGIPLATPLTDEDLARVTVIHAAANGIADLTGMEFCVNLVEADFSSNAIVDLMPLQGLIELAVLNIGYNAIDDLTAIGQLVKLRRLSMDVLKNTTVPDHVDISALSNLRQLNYLSAGANYIHDVGPIASLTQLETLILDQNLIDNEQAARLSALSNLTYLDIGEGAFSDASFIGSLVKLTHLGLNECSFVSDISFLESLGQLTELNLANCGGIFDFSPLAGAIALTTLDVQSSSLRNHAILSTLVRLRKVNFSHTSARNLDFLSNMSDLQEAIFQGNTISDLSALAGLDKLRIIYALQNRIVDLTPVANCSHLLEVNVSQNRVTALAPLEACPLVALFADDNYLTDVDEMARFVSDVGVTSFDGNYYIGTPRQNAFRAVDPISVQVGGTVSQLFEAVYTQDGITYDASSDIRDEDAFKMMQMVIADPSVAQGILRGVDPLAASLLYDIEGLKSGATAASIHFRASSSIEAVMPFTTAAMSVPVTVVAAPQA
ncbi:leucine-rich repeat domain-containing protein [Paraburkholderia sp. BCC1884]|uniref:leucine-rich repeat domain-containing protein n=1 Tax=Paraburkholderia sp. BCC1884 TaxID=2562668 RepID=UPI001183F969|nr:leucine-rich repeat domain-containing protein [Paraburkholderia sp. BCC1884]